METSAIKKSGSMCVSVGLGDGWVVTVITRLQLLVDIITKGQLRAAARPQRETERERGELRSLNQTFMALFLFLPLSCASVATTAFS